MHIYTILVYHNTLVMIAYICYCYEVFTYPKFMDRDFQKVLQALTAFDKKLSTLEDVVKQLAEANINYATSQQELNKGQSELNRDLGDGIKMLGDNLAEVIQFLQKIGGKN